MSANEFIRLVDYNKHNCNIKGGTKQNNYKLIIFTSITPFNAIYDGVEDNEQRYQWEKRIINIHLTHYYAEKQLYDIEEYNKLYNIDIYNNTNKKKHIYDPRLLKNNDNKDKTGENTITLI